MYDRHNANEIKAVISNNNQEPFDWGYGPTENNTYEMNQRGPDISTSQGFFEQVFI